MKDSISDRLNGIAYQCAALCGALFVLVLSGCGPQYHMGDTLSADPKIKVAQTGSASAPRHYNEWDLKWRAIQSRNDTVGWTDHFQVCALKYRFRNYDELFRCLDLLDAKIAAGGKRVPKAERIQRYAPVMTGWLRASAYAELGEPETALKWAQSAWDALPAPYRTADSMVTDPGMYFSGREDLKSVFAMYYIGASLGSVGLGTGDTEMQEGMFHEGRGNPAALDLRPVMVAMALAEQRTLLYQRLGDTQNADAAFADLERWQDLRQLVPGALGYGHRTSDYTPYRAAAQLDSIGPLFARGQYQQVIGIYETMSLGTQRLRQRESVKNAVYWTLFLPFKALETAIEAPLNSAMFPDARMFSLAVEDAANALLYAQSLAKVGRTDEARAMFDTLLAMPEIRAMGNLYWATLYERGVIALRAGRRDEGVRLLSQSIEALESVRSTIAYEAAKIGFAGDKQAVYGELIGALAQAGDWQQAFAYAERAKARAFVDLLAQRRDLAPPPSSDAQVRELFSRAATVDSSVGFAATDASVRGIKVVGDARDNLSRIAPEAASLVSVQKIDTASILSRLADDETLVEYYAHDNELYTFLLTRTGIGGTVLSAQNMDADVRAFRDGIQRRSPDSVQPGRALYDRLIRPLLPRIAGTKLTIVPHGSLHYLPFAALSDGQDYLVDHYGLRLLPSASTLVYLRTEAVPKLGKLLAIGNPDLGKRALDLPNAQLEAVAIAAMFPDSRALLREEASKSAVKQLGGGFSILHFATHGRFDADSPLSSGLYLAKGTEPDGVLTVSDLYSLNWNVDLVTLSGCDTGLGKVTSGDDVIGLTRGFLYAGSRSIVASLWHVDDAATAHLMESFYQKLSSNDKREALRLAQIETRKQYPEPWYWAAFNMVGRPD